jgi:predicted nuclease of predicted toxin-antitoxin system
MGKTKILVDENLGTEVAEILRGQRLNAVFAGDIGLVGRSDEELFAYAWREKRMLWTHDRDFLDDDRFPEHRNPGILILPGGDGNPKAMRIGLDAAISLFALGGYPEWRHSKCVISPTGEISIRRRHTNGRMITVRYRFGRVYAEEWVE